MCTHCVCAHGRAPADVGRPRAPVHARTAVHEHRACRCRSPRPALGPHAGRPQSPPRKAHEPLGAQRLRAPAPECAFAGLPSTTPRGSPALPLPQRPRRRAGSPRGLLKLRRAGGGRAHAGGLRGAPRRRRRARARRQPAGWRVSASAAGARPQAGPRTSAPAGGHLSSRRLLPVQVRGPRPCRRPRPRPEQWGGVDEGGGEEEPSPPQRRRLPPAPEGRPGGHSLQGELGLGLQLGTPPRGDPSPRDPSPREAPPPGARPAALRVGGSSQMG
ncbi:unnamed protein product [Nyctereutes procyonoides]|uniref:(raccoon dog) hypothetical protein n=1 Tax=Nyctereutes procyonoides TaxID=34880 RepID=A0A811YV45_NYCPR|nr:unnamed protein product [Nyctereutes procyonoides]